MLEKEESLDSEEKDKFSENSDFDNEIPGVSVKTTHIPDNLNTPEPSRKMLNKVPAVKKKQKTKFELNELGKGNSNSSSKENICGYHKYESSQQIRSGLSRSNLSHSSNSPSNYSNNENDNNQVDSFKNEKENSKNDNNRNNLGGGNPITLKKLYSYRRPFSKNKRRLIFILICIINVLINCDHGAIPAGTKELKEENNLSNIQLGTIGSLVYLGLVFGSLIGGFLFSTYSSKWLIIVSLYASCLFLYCFTFIKTCLGMALSRMGCGFCQVFCYIYFPVWVDQYGVNNMNTLWLTFLQLGVPLGTMLGYVTEALCIKYYDSWKGAFYCQILCIGICSTVLFIIPDKFFSKNYRHSESTQEEIEKEFKDLKELFQTKKTIVNNKYLVKNMELIDNIYNSKYGRPSLYSIFSMIDDYQGEGSKKYFCVIKDLIINKKYIFSLLAVSSMFFVVTGIQFWISDYMREILGIPSSKVYIIFSVVCITAPTLGVLTGGIFIQYLGGYTNKAALDACFKISIFAGICGVLLPYFNNLVVFIIFMWLLLFFGGSITPGLTGIIIASIPENSKELGNSITQLCYNLLGYLPSPFIYGFVCKYTGGSESRWGLTVLLFWAVLGVCFLFFARKSDFLQYEDEFVESTKTEMATYENIILNDVEDNENDNNKKVLLSRITSKDDLPAKSHTLHEKTNIITHLFGRTS